MGPTSLGVCRLCGLERTFKNSSETKGYEAYFKTKLEPLLVHAVEDDE